MASNFALKFKKAYIKNIQGNMQNNIQDNIQDNIQNTNDNNYSYADYSDYSNIINKNIDEFNILNIDNIDNTIDDIIDNRAFINNIPNTKSNTKSNKFINNNILSFSKKNKTINELIKKRFKKKVKNVKFNENNNIIHRIHYSHDELINKKIIYDDAIMYQKRLYDEYDNGMARHILIDNCGVRRRICIRYVKRVLKGAIKSNEIAKKIIIQHIRRIEGI